MELEHIKNNVYYLRYAINIGVVAGQEGQASLLTQASATGPGGGS